MKISFLGGGNMAAALIGGLLQRGFAASDVCVVELQPAARAALAERFAVRTCAAVDDSALDCAVWVLAVKPQQMQQALRALAGRVGKALVLSIAAGVRMAELQRWLRAPEVTEDATEDERDGVRIVRAMPNTPALIGAGVTGLCAGPGVDAELRERAESILRAVGETVWVAEERLMDAVTALSGSGPAYVFRFIEALEEGGRRLGLDAATAHTLALHTTLGAAQLAANSTESPTILRERVTSPGGTTEAALASLASSGWHAHLIEALAAAEARGRELGDLLAAASANPPKT